MEVLEFFMGDAELDAAERVRLDEIDEFPTDGTLREPGLKLADHAGGGQALKEAAYGAGEAPPASDKRSGSLRHVQPLLPPQQGPSGTALFKGALSAQGTAWRTPVEETTEVHVSIGRIEVTAVHEAPQPKRAPARSQRALSLEEYLARRKAGRS